jgi:Fungal specific transcription factor domain
MALQDPDLMNLLLAYSASHRARLLQQPEPVVRVSIWVKDVFPNLRLALSDPSRVISNANLAAAIMLSSLEIISPRVFGISVPWQQHLHIARAMVLARGGVRSMYFERSDVTHFLIHWFAYLDVLGSLVAGPVDPPAPIGNPDSPTDKGRNGWLAEYDFDVEDDYKIHCLFGFTGRCITLLAHIAELARACDIERIDANNNIRLEWTPSVDVVERAEKLIVDLEAARTSTLVQACPHLHSASEAAYQWDIREMTATNEAFHWAGIVHIHRRILGKRSIHPDVQNAVREICGALYKIRKGSTAEFCLLFPMFTAGCDAQDEKQKSLIMDRFRGIDAFGMSQVGRRTWILYCRS